MTETRQPVAMVAAGWAWGVRMGVCVGKRLAVAEAEDAQAEFGARGGERAEDGRDETAASVEFGLAGFRVGVAPHDVGVVQHRLLLFVRLQARWLTGGVFAADRPACATASLREMFALRAQNQVDGGVGMQREHGVGPFRSVHRRWRGRDLTNRW